MASKALSGSHAHDGAVEYLRFLLQLASLVDCQHRLRANTILMLIAFLYDAPQAECLRADRDTVTLCRVCALATRRIVRKGWADTEALPRLR